MKKFNAIVSGDGECFCFKVDAKTFIEIVGQKEYDSEISRHREMMELTIDKSEIKDPDTFMIYPCTLLGYDSKDVEIEIDDREEAITDIKTSRIERHKIKEVKISVLRK